MTDMFLWYPTKRVPGADMNPFYTLAAILACGLHGIKEQLSIPFPPLGHGKPGPGASSSKAEEPPLPRTLQAATEAMKEFCEKDIRRWIRGSFWGHKAK